MGGDLRRRRVGLRTAVHGDPQGSPKVSARSRDERRAEDGRRRAMMAPMEELARSPIRFARVDGVAIAYQTWGDGPIDVVAVPPLAQNIELTWERPEYRAILRPVGRLRPGAPLRQAGHGRVRSHGAHADRRPAGRGPRRRDGRRRRRAGAPARRCPRAARSPSPSPPPTRSGSRRSPCSAPALASSATRRTRSARPGSPASRYFHRDVGHGGVGDARRLRAERGR